MNFIQTNQVIKFELCVRKTFSEGGVWLDTIPEICFASIWPLFYAFLSKILFLKLDRGGTTLACKGSKLPFSHFCFFFFKSWYKAGIVSGPLPHVFVPSSQAVKMLQLPSPNLASPSKHPNSLPTLCWSRPGYLLNICSKTRWDQFFWSCCRI